MKGFKHVNFTKYRGAFDAVGKVSDIWLGVCFKGRAVI